MATPQTSAGGRPVSGVAHEVLGAVDIATVTGTVTVSTTDAGGNTEESLGTLLQQTLEVLRCLLDECRATRLAVSDLVNDGKLHQQDYLDLARSARDSADEA